MSLSIQATLPHPEAHLYPSIANPLEAVIEIAFDSYSFDEAITVLDSSKRKLKGMKFPQSTEMKYAGMMGLMESGLSLKKGSLKPDSNLEFEEADHFIAFYNQDFGLSTPEHKRKLMLMIDEALFGHLPSINPEISRLNMLLVEANEQELLSSAEPLLIALQKSIILFSKLYPSEYYARLISQFIHLSLLKAHCLSSKPIEAKNLITIAIQKITPFQTDSIAPLYDYLHLLEILTEESIQIPKRGLSFNLLIRAIEQKTNYSLMPKDMPLDKSAEDLLSAGQFKEALNSQCIDTELKNAALALLGREDEITDENGDLLKHPTISTLIAFCKDDYQEARRLALEDEDIWTPLAIQFMDKYYDELSEYSDTFEELAHSFSAVKS